VVSGDCIVVADDAAPYGSPAAERRVNLSSIRAPRIGNPKKDEKPAAYAREAKEYLRNLLIGNQVRKNPLTVIQTFTRSVFGSMFEYYPWK
jgi:staphylococcal nuclease domain-containing protein 1